MSADNPQNAGPTTDPLIEKNPAQNQGAKGISRRGFLAGSSATAVMLAFYLPGCFDKGKTTAASATFKPNAFLRIESDNRIRIICSKSEMGQGVHTSFAMLIAEELDADWQQVSVENAPVDSDYNHWGGMFSPYSWIMFTGQSRSTRDGHLALRETGAAARAMLVAAAAKQWSVPEGQLHTDNSQVIDPQSGRKVNYGELVGLAANSKPPRSPKLKAPSEFRLLGKQIKRVEGRSKITGQASYGIDVRLPGMKYAAVARAPFGASLKSVDERAAKTVKGVLKVKQIPSGVAVIAETFWQAKQGRDALQIEWQRPWKKSHDDLVAEYRSLLNEKGHKAESRGNVEKALATAGQVIEAEFQFPFLAHATMEPMNCTVHDHGDRAELWTGSQQQTFHRNAAASALGYDGDRIDLHNQQLGGGFGRRTALDGDFILDAVHTAKGEPWPVNMLWTREDDMRAGNYRPMFMHKARLGLGSDGLPSAWMHRVAGQTVMLFPLSNVDDNSVEGLQDQPYEVKNFRVEVHNPESPIPTLWWRSTGYSHNGMVVESLIDQAAQLAGRDAIEYRKQLLSKHPRMIKVLEKVAAMAHWGQVELAKGQGMGVAIVEAFESIAAQIVQVTITDKTIKVDKVWCAVDCGFAYNPLNVKAQMESGIIFGLSAALLGEIELENGDVKQSNFHDYPVLRLNQTPAIEVEIINSGAKVGGVGEVGTPPIAPAVGNAVYAATGQRLRVLPFKLA